MFNIFYQKYLDTLQHTYKYRKLVNNFDAKQSYIDFASNDYLCLSNNPQLLLSATEAATKYGVGATGSRLLSGNFDLFRQFESRIAQDKNMESALIFNSGFQTNFSVLSSLLDQKVLQTKPIVFFDRLNHSSLYQAIFLSGAELIRYRHNDMQHLSDILHKHQHENRPKFIVTETIFGMDGDVLQIKDIVNLARQYSAFLYLDEAHATGMVGHNGYGISTLVNLHDLPCLVMGTFSKALGVSGGYIACSQTIRNYIINRAPGFIYSTANSPLVIGAAFKAWQLIKTLSLTRDLIASNADYLRHNVKKLGLNIGLSSTNIVPIIIGKEEMVIKANQLLLNDGIIASCIRPPTVPLGTSRLRVALNAKHTKQDIDKLIAVLKRV